MLLFSPILMEIETWEVTNMSPSPRRTKSDQDRSRQSDTRFEINRSPRSDHGAWPDLLPYHKESLTFIRSVLGVFQFTYSLCQTPLLNPFTTDWTVQSDWWDINSSLSGTLTRVYTENEERLLITYMYIQRMFSELNSPGAGVPTATSQI